MIKFLKILILTIGFGIASGASGDEDSTPSSANTFEAQVATLCTPSLSLTNSYMTGSGSWAPDPLNTSCLTEKLQILKFCQRTYPTKNINNIVESSHNVKVGFCKKSGFLGKSGRGCIGKVSKWVKPYRCLESPFQSDALLVPSPCLFDHVHNASLCLDSKIWNKTAVQSCLKRGLSLKSYAVLLPCGVGLFTGVEFVCCPLPPPKPDDEEYDEYDDEYDEEDDESEEVTSTTTSTSTAAPTVDPYFRRYDSYNEHQNFLDAEERLEDVHKNRINHVMEDWGKLEDRYQAMRDNDPKGAEDFKKAVTLRFQKTVKSLEEESLAEKKQLIAVHQQRVQSHLNERKKEAMECFTRGLNERPQNPHRVRKCMERLMRALHKDRHHALSHYKHSLATPESLTSTSRDFTLERLGQITNTARESLNMLERYPKLNAELRPLIEDYVLALQGRDDPPGSLLTSTHDTEEVLLDKLAGIFVATTTTTTTTRPLMTQAPTTSTTEEGQQQDIIFPSAGGQSEVKGTLDVTDEPPVAELYRENEIEHAHAQIDEFQTEAKTFSVHREVYHKENKSVYFTMAFAGIAVFGAMVTGLVVLRRRNPRNQGFLAVHQNPSACPPSAGEASCTTPEEKHVVNMQVNGYENPTYKFFETK